MKILGIIAGIVSTMAMTVWIMRGMWFQTVAFALLAAYNFYSAYKTLKTPGSPGAKERNEET